MFNPMMRSLLRDPDPTPGGGGGTPPAGGQPNPGAVAFDPAAFETKFMDNLNKGINGIEKRLEAKFKAMIPAQSAPPNQNPDPNPDPNPGIPLTKAELKVKELEIELNRQKATISTSEQQQKTLLDQIQKTEAARLRAERRAIVGEGLTGISWADEQAAKDAYDLLSPRVKWSEELDKWVGEDDVTDAARWVKDQVLARKSWQAPQPTNSAAARPGTHNGGPSFDMDGITPEAIAKMDAGTKKQWTDHLRKQLGMQTL